MVVGRDKGGRFLAGVRRAQRKAETEREAKGEQRRDGEAMVGGVGAGDSDGGGGV